VTPPCAVARGRSPEGTSGWCLTPLDRPAEPMRCGRRSQRLPIGATPQEFVGCFADHRRGNQLENRSRHRDGAGRVRRGRAGDRLRIHLRCRTFDTNPATTEVDVPDPQRCHFTPPQAGGRQQENDVGTLGFVGQLMHLGGSQVVARLGRRFAGQLHATCRVGGQTPITHGSVQDARQDGCTSEPPRTPTTAALQLHGGYGYLRERSRPLTTRRAGVRRSEGRRGGHARLHGRRRRCRDRTCPAGPGGPGEQDNSLRWIGNRAGRQTVQQHGAGRAADRRREASCWPSSSACSRSRCSM
jgi:hypothetical protein